MANDRLRTLWDLLAHSAARQPDRLAVADDSSARSYSELATAAEQFGSMLYERGMRKGNRVLVCLPNTVSFVVAHFGILSRAGVSVPIDASATPATAAMIAQLSGAAFAVISPATSAAVAEALVEAGVGVVIRFGGSPDAYGSVTDMKLVRSSERSAAELACLMFTTGSTALPKGVPLRHENVLAAINHITEFLEYSADDREVVMLPISHSFGLGHVYCNIKAGGAVRLCDGMAKVGRVLKAVREFGATGFPGTPLSYGLLLDHYRDAFVKSCERLRFIVVNSAALPVERARELMAALPKTEIVVYYGLTEASRSTMLRLRTVSEERLSSVGRAMSEVDLRIEDPLGNELQRGLEGQVTISAPTVPGEYWGDPEGSPSGYTNGRLQTGDLGYLDTDGYLFLTGRLKDQINVGGSKVAPREIEDTIRTVSFVEDVAAVGLPSADGVDTEVVVACVVLKARPEMWREHLREHCLRRLEFFKVPTEFYSVPRIPRAVTGKLLRPELRVLAENCRAGETE